MALAAAVAAVLAAAAAASTAASGQAPDSDPPSLLDAVPDLNLNGAPPTLTLAFDEDVAAAPAGAVPGANASLIEITGVSGRPVVGLAGAAAGHLQGSQSTLVVNLTREQHGALSAAHRFAAPLRLAVGPGAVHDASGNPFAGVGGASMDVTPDTTRPLAAGAASLLNLTDGTLRMHFDEAIDAARTDLSGMAVHVAVSPSETVVTPMDGATALQGEPGELVVALTEAQRLRLVGLRQTGSGSAAGALLVTVSHTAVPDFAGNYWIGTFFSSGDAPVVVGDESGPAFAAAAPPPLLNLRAGTLALYFDEAVNGTAVRASLIGVGLDGQASPVSLAGAQVLSQADSDVLVLGLGAAQAAALRDVASSAAANASAAAAASGGMPPPLNWTAVVGRGAVSDMAGNPFGGASAAAAAVLHAPAAPRHPCMDGAGPCRYGITASYGQAAARAGTAVSVSADGGRSYVAYDPPPGSRAAHIDAISLQDGYDILASIEFEPPAPGMLSSVRLLALDGATGAPLAAVQESHAPRGAGQPAAIAANASSYVAPVHPATLGELRRVPLSYLSYNGTPAGSDEPVSVGTDAAGRRILAAVSGGASPVPASWQGSPYRERGAVLSAGADTLEPHPMYLSAPDPLAGYYHPAHAWRPTAMAVGAPAGAGRAPAPAYVAGESLGGTAAAAAADGPPSPGPYGIHTVSFGNASSGFTPNYTAVHSLELAGPQAASRPGADPPVITSLALDWQGGALYALHANGTLAVHALGPGQGPAAGYAVPSGGVRVSQGLAGAAGGPGIALDGARGLLYAARADLSSVVAYDLRAAPGPAPAAPPVPVVGPVRALAASASDGTVHVLAGLDPAAGPGAGGSAVYVVSPAAQPLSLEAPPSLDLRTGELALDLDRSADASGIDASGMVLWGAGRALEPVRLDGALLPDADTDMPVIVLTEAQRRAAAAAHAWDGPLMLNVSERAVPGLFGAPLAAASALPVDIAAGVDNASIVSAAVTGPREIRVEYDTPVNASAASYSGVVLAPGGARAVEGIDGAGTAVHTLLLAGGGGAPLPPDAAGVIDVSRLPDMGARSTFDGAAAAPVADAQRPSALSATVVNASLAVVVFDEPVDGVDASDFGDLSVGAPPRAPAVFAVVSVSGSGASRLVGAGGGPPGGLPGNAHGSLAVMPGSFEDLAGNSNGAGQDLYVTPGRPTATTDGRTPVPAAAEMYASTVVATSDLGASVDLSPLGGRPLPGEGVLTIDTFAAAALLPSGSSVVSGMPADGVVRVSPSAVDVGPRAQIGGGRVLAAADSGGPGGSEVRLDAPAAIVVYGAAGGVAFSQAPGAAAPEAVRGWCGGQADAAVRPAELRAAAEAHLNGTGSCAADLDGDKVIVSFVLTTFGVVARAQPGVQNASAAAVCAEGAAEGAAAGESAGGLGPCPAPPTALLDTGGRAATGVAVSAAAQGPVFVAARGAPAAAQTSATSDAGPSVLVYGGRPGMPPSAAAGLGSAGSEILALDAGGGAGSAYAVVAPAGPAGREGGTDAAPVELVRIDADGMAGQAPARLSYVDATGREARVGSSDRITALHVDHGAGRAYVAVLSGPGERSGLGTDGTIISVDTAADPDRVIRQYAGPYDPALAAAGPSHYYYPAEAWRPTALAVGPGGPGGGPPTAYSVGARLAGPAAAPGSPLSGPMSFGVQAVSFGDAASPARFTPNYTLAGEALVAAAPGSVAGAGAVGGAMAVPGLPAAGAAVDGAGEKLYVLYGNGTLAAYAVAPAGGPRLLYVLDVLAEPAGLDMDEAGGILYAAGSGGIRAYDVRADLLIGSLGLDGTVVDMDAAAAAVAAGGTLYVVMANGSVLTVGIAAAVAQEDPPTALESIVASTPDGGTALVPPGTYRNESLVLDRPVRLAADSPGSAVLGPSSRITVLVPRSGIVSVEGIAFNGTACAGGDPSLPASAAVRVSDGAWWNASGRRAAGAGLGGSVVVSGSSFLGTCGAAVHSDAAGASGLAVRSNTLESAGAGGADPRASIVIDGLAGRASVASNHVFGSSGYAVSVSNASGVLVSGNRVEDAAGGVSSSSSSAVRVSGNVFAGVSGPAVAVQGARGAAANATGVLSDGLAAVLNDVRGADVALSVGRAAGPDAAGNATAAAPHVRFNYNTLHPHGGRAPAVSIDDASAAVDARSNYYPGLAGAELPRMLGSAAASPAVLSDPAAAPPGGPVRIGVLLDPLSLPHVDGPAAEAARAAADEANRRAAGSALMRPVELVEASGTGAGAWIAAGGAAGAARAIESGAAGDVAAEPALLRGIGMAMSWYAESPGDAPARMAEMPDRGYAVFAADRNGIVLAAGGAPAGGGAAAPVPGRPVPAAAAEPAAFARAVEALDAAAAAAGTTAAAPAAAAAAAAASWIGHALDGGTVVRTLLASGGGGGGEIIFGASYDAGPPPDAYVGPTSAAALADAAAALPAGTPIVSPGVVDGRAVKAAGESVFSMAPAASGSSAPVAGQVMSEERVAAVIPVVQADDYSLRFADAALAEYAARSADGLALRPVTFAPSEASGSFWSSVAEGMDAAASGLASSGGGLERHEIAVLYVGGAGPFEALASHALPHRSLAGAQWYVGDAIAQITDVRGLFGNGSGGLGARGAPPPWHAPGAGAGNATSATALSRQTSLVAFALEPAHGLAVDPNVSAAAAAVLGDVRLRLASAPLHSAAPAADDTMSTAYAYLAHDAVLLLAQAVQEEGAGAPGRPGPGHAAAIRQAASLAAAPYDGRILGRVAFDPAGLLAHPAPYALWSSAPSGPPVRAGSVASPSTTCGTSLADGRLDFGGVYPGNVSRQANQTVTNTGTAPLAGVVIGVTNWTATAAAAGIPHQPGAANGTVGPGAANGTVGPGEPLLPFNMTELAVGGAPPGMGQPGGFSPIPRNASVAQGLAPGNSLQLQFVLNLTTVKDAPAAPIEQLVTYDISCR